MSARRQVFLMGALCAVSALPMFAQSASVVRSNSFEVGGFLGASFGIDRYRVMGGGNVTYALNKWLLPYAEFSYFPGIGRVEEGTFPGTGRPFELRYSLPLADYHGGVHIRMPIRESRIVPYGVFGLGAVRSFGGTVDATFADATGTRTTQLERPSSTNFAVNYGGGLRYYINQRFGIRAEAKAYRPTGDNFNRTFGKVEFGFFLQLR